MFTTFLSLYHKKNVSRRIIGQRIIAIMLLQHICRAKIVWRNMRSPLTHRAPLGAKQFYGGQFYEKTSETEWNNNNIKKICSKYNTISIKACKNKVKMCSDEWIKLARQHIIVRPVSAPMAASLTCECNKF